mgnify:FL=1
MIKIYQGGSTGLEQQKAKRYPKSRTKGIKVTITESLKKDFDFDLVLIQNGCFYEAVDDGAEFLNKHFQLKLYGVNHYSTGFPEGGLDEKKKLLDDMNINYCILDQLKKNKENKIQRVVSFSTIEGADGLIF